MVSLVLGLSSFFLVFVIVLYVLLSGNLRRLCESNIFWCQGAVLDVGACYVFPRGVLAIVLLMGSMFGVGETEPALDIWVEQPLALWLSQPC